MTDDHGCLNVPDLPAPLPWRVSARARRYLLRVRPQDGVVELVVPRRANLAKAMQFASENSGWIARKLEARAPRLPFVPGARFELLGNPTVVEHRPQQRGGVWLEGDRLCVSGQTEHANRRITDWLKRLARNEIGTRVLAAADRIGRPVSRVTVRDTSSRWGSCTGDGRLSFSWRLVLAPEGVLQYVIAHEVAHLKEMNHGQRFWTLVELLAPGAAPCRDWLRQNGTLLLSYG